MGENEMNLNEIDVASWGKKSEPQVKISKPRKKKSSSKKLESESPQLAPFKEYTTQQIFETVYSFCENSLITSYQQLKNIIKKSLNEKKNRTERRNEIFQANIIKDTINVLLENFYFYPKIKEEK